MTHLIDAPEAFAAQALQGCCDIHARLVRPTPGDGTRAKEANAWADRAVGTSGAIWGLGPLAASRALSDSTGVTAEQVRLAAEQALESVMALGGAKPGDKTLVDAFLPFVDALSADIRAGSDRGMAWRRAAEVAGQAAQGTAPLRPKLGRARPLAERSLGHPDAGAVSFALCTRVMSDLQGETP